MSLLLNGLSGDVPNKRSLENGHIPKYKSRRISAVRDFPPMCGRNSVPLVIVKQEQVCADADVVVDGHNSRSSKVNNVALVNGVGNHRIANPVESEAVGVKAADVPEFDETRNSGRVDISGVEVRNVKLEAQLDEAGKSTTNGDVTEHVDAVNAEVRVNETPVVEIGHARIRSPKDDEIHEDGVVNNHIAVECAESGALMGEVRTTVGMDGNCNGIGELITETELMKIDKLNNGTKSFSSGEEDTEAGNSVAPSSCFGSIKPRDKYRQRTVSVVRDFPPNCGRNVPLPNDEGREMATSWNLEKFVKDEVEPDSSMPEDVVDCESNHIKETEMSQGLIRARTGSDDNGEALWLGENATRVSDGNDKVPSPQDRCSLGGEIVVVHGLMAAPYCPWRKGKRDSKDSTGRWSRVDDPGPCPSNFLGMEDGHPVNGCAHNVTPISMFMPEPDSEDDSPEPIGTEIVVYSPGKSNELQHSADGMVPDCSGRNRKGNLENSDRGKSRDKKGTQKTKSWRDKAKAVAKKSVPQIKSPRLSSKKQFDDDVNNVDADGNRGALVPVDDNHNEASRNKPPVFKATSGVSRNSSGHVDARSRVRDTLRTFNLFRRKLLQQEEAQSSLVDEGQSKQSGKKPKRIDLQSVNLIKEHGKEVNTDQQYLGHVPGVEVGDEFQYRVELAIVGLHRHYQAGIDSMQYKGRLVCTSIVSSGAYGDDVNNADVLLYSGQGGNVLGKSKEPEDQQLVRGNLALANSISAGTPVRVIRGWKVSRSVDPLDSKTKTITIYVYDGLYTVESYSEETGSHGKKVFMFKLTRNPGQPELAWKELKESSKSKIRKGVCVVDISGGKESFPICAVNTLDDEKPPRFTYTAKMIYPKWYKPKPPPGCDCTGMCSGSKSCRCTIMNGGEIPYNHNGAIVETKSLVYECGPNCRCPPSCYNRVTQRIKVKLEIFKTESRGWGLRSPISIPSGTFICEYAGELLEDKEAEERIDNDEYLFDIGLNYSDSSVMSEEQTASTELVEGGYTIDAGQFGNIGRFINHSCSPNLYAQNVLYDHEDKRMPHVMLFAMENIPPLKELTYHYNYTIGQIYDADGNVKVKKCYCGSAECRGRMY